jgi:hypothetical protein
MKDQGLKLGLGLLTLPFGVVIHGYVLMKLWAMFISTKFSIPELSVLEAAGIMLVIDFIIMKIDWSNYADEIEFQEYVTKTVAHIFLTPFVILVMGCILKAFM